MRNPITLEQRQILEKFKDSSLDAKEIGLLSGMFYSTASVEYKRGGGRSNYNAQIAHELSQKRLEKIKKSHESRKSPPKSLDLQTRKLIEKYKDTELSGAKIGEKIGKHKNVINREFNLFKTRGEYNADLAQKMRDQKKEEGHQKIRKKIIITEKRPGIEELDLSKEFIDSFKNKQISNEIESSNAYNLPKLTLNIWIERFKEEEAPTRRNWKKEIRYFEFWSKYLGNKIAIDISSREIEEVADIIMQQPSRHKKQLSKETKRKFLLYLSSLYSTAIYKWKWAIFNPLSCVDKKKSKQNYIPDQTQNQSSIELKKKFISLVKKFTSLEDIPLRKQAEKCGVSLSVFQNAVSLSCNTTLKVFMKICDKFGVSLELVETGNK